MPIIDYEELLKSSDMRIVKTKHSIFNALIELLKSQSLYRITITDLCKTALINRKTFYSHYTSVEDAYAGFEYAIIQSFLSILDKEHIIGINFFNPKKLIYRTNQLVEENKEYFELLFKYMRTGLFMRRLGETSGNLSLQYAKGLKTDLDTSVYCYAFVFAITGLITAYFDWIDFGRQISIEELANTSEAVFSSSIKSILEEKTNI